MLVRLLYASRALDENRAAAIESIMLQSRTHNPERGITGILCYGGDIFMQVLEGDRMEVNALYAHIQKDVRHKDVVILRYEEIHERRFSGWTMGHVNIDKLNPSVLLKYSARPTLDPYSVSGEVSMALLEELIQTASIIGRA
jgi:Sensors of blue-light using FAD